MTLLRTSHQSPVGGSGSFGVRRSDRSSLALLRQASARLAAELAADPTGTGSPLGRARTSQTVAPQARQVLLHSVILFAHYCYQQMILPRIVLTQ